jgi:hypothetical protein
MDLQDKSVPLKHHPHPGNIGFILNLVDLSGSYGV